MEIEFEAKFYPVEKAKIRKCLRDLGAKLVVAERQMKRMIFDKPVNPQIKGDYIRVRDEGPTVRMSFKIHARIGQKLSDQKEIDVEVSDFDKTIEILKAAGLKPNRYQETLRETWEYDGAEIDIDTWPGLKPYVEIEADSEEKVKEVAEELGFDWNRKIITAVVEIFGQVYNLSSEEVLEKIRHITFEKNPFKNLKKAKN